MNFKGRICAVYGFLLMLTLFVAFRLYVVTNTNTASEALSGQYLRRIDVTEQRGFIFDRSGKPLSARKIGNICLVNPLLCDDMKEVSEKIAELSEKPQSEIYDRMLRGVPFTTLTDGEAEVDGVYCFPMYERSVTCAEHIVGYVNSDGRGVVGAEKFFDGILSRNLFSNVTYRYTANARGIPLSDKGCCVYNSGYGEGSGVFLTLSKDLQLICEEIAERYDLDGAICITDTDSGEILASVSSPGFDADNIGMYLSGGNGELVNRCTSGYTPGSVFKTVVAAAALEEDAELFDYIYECKGFIRLENGDEIPCHKADGHGAVTMKEAYALSCNPYFISLALKVGGENVVQMSEEMGMTGSLSVDGVLYTNASLGKYPSDSTLEEGYVANLAIGQGRVLSSPLNVCTAFSCAFTGEKRIPSVALKICDGDSTIRDYTSERSSERVLTDETVTMLCEMMQACVEEGLGRDARTEKFGAMGKTATAQSGRIRDGREILNLWFCGIYPGEDRNFTVCVLVCSSENNGSAKKIFREICSSEALNGSLGQS